MKNDKYSGLYRRQLKTINKQKKQIKAQNEEIKKLKTVNSIAWTFAAFFGCLIAAGIMAYVENIPLPQFAGL